MFGEIGSQPRNKLEERKMNLYTEKESTTEDLNEPQDNLYT